MSVLVPSEFLLVEILIMLRLWKHFDALMVASDSFGAITDMQS